MKTLYTMSVIIPFSLRLLVFSSVKKKKKRLEAKCPLIFYDVNFPKKNSYQV